MCEDVAFEVADSESGRLDVFLSRRLGRYSRSRIKAWCDDERAAVNGVPKKPSFVVQPGDRVALRLPKEATCDGIVPEDLPLDIVYEDDDIAVINKAAGMVVHPGAGVRTGTLVHALAHHLDALSSQGGADRPGIVHRLDKGTSGLILVAKNDAAHGKLAQQWQDRQVIKVYQALVWGHPKPTQGTVSTTIGRSLRDPRRMAAEVPSGRQAFSRYKTLEAFHEAARVNIQILTGRTHQIRVHMSHLGCPVVGDALYGGRIHRAFAKRFSHMPAHPMLHAGLLRFDHPTAGEPMSFKCQPPEAFSRCAQALAVFPYEA